MKLLLCCFLPTKDRPEPDLAWKASVQYGPVVYRATRRQALRCATEAWLKASGDAASSFQVNLVMKTELTVRQLTAVKAMDYMNGDTGLSPTPRVSDET